jgi:hypothetical protein
VLPVRGFFFNRPLVLIQSDDWGRVGVRDLEAVDSLRAEGIDLGAKAYDFYSLESAADVDAIREMLSKHRDRTGRAACLEMNFIVANLDFDQVARDQYRRIHLRPLADGLPGRWKRPGLFDAYRHGVEDGVFFPALHGVTHFNRAAVLRALAREGERRDILCLLWGMETPYIYWRMPWVGYEYCDPDIRGGFLPPNEQTALVREAVSLFSRLFSRMPVSACAPGYRANHHTLSAWKACGIRVAQNGPGQMRPPHFEGELLHLLRTFDFEPAVDASFGLATCLAKAEEAVASGLPVVISIHSINFHSMLKDFRSATLRLLDEFLTLLEKRHPDLLYLNGSDLYEIVQHGSYETHHGAVKVGVKQRIVSLRGSKVAVGA